MVEVYFYFFNFFFKAPQLQSRTFSRFRVNCFGLNSPGGEEGGGERKREWEGREKKR